jgi:hypothetical protein
MLPMRSGKASLEESSMRGIDKLPVAELTKGQFCSLKSEQGVAKL